MKSYPQGAAFTSHPRPAPPTLIVLHESASPTRASTVRALQAQGYGVHYTVDRDGSVEQHVPLGAFSVHAGAGRNRNSVAVEVVNAYYGKAGAPGTIPAVWTHRKSPYILPTAVQLAALWGLVHELGGATGVADYPSKGDAFTWGRVKGIAKGVSAHHRWGHADGLFPEHYCWLRARGVSHDEAYRATIEAAQACGRSRVTTYKGGVA